MRFPWLSRNSPADEIKNRSYLVYSEWGPQLQVPREQRLAESFPEIPANVRAEWITEFERINAKIWKTVQAGGPGTTSFEAFKKRMLRSFPFMDEKSLSRAWTLTGYYAWHEGY